MVVFDPVVRTILILEDDEDYRVALEVHCKRALANLKKQSLVVDLTILRATSLAEAQQLIQQYQRPINIISVDIGLNPSNGATMGKPALGGLSILDHFQDLPDTLAIVVSGEQGQIYPLEAFQTYGVLNYIVKLRPNEQEMYIASIEAALWYLTAYDLLQMPLDALDTRDLERAAVAWQNALNAAEKAQIRDRYLPQPLNDKIEQYRTRYLHTDTNLPIGEWSYAKLRRYIVSNPSWDDDNGIPSDAADRPSEWTMLRIRLDGYTQLIEHYGSQKQALITIFARSIKNIMQDTYQDKLIFLGHLDRDIGQSEPFLIAILNTIDETRFDDIQTQIETMFQEASEKVLPSPQLATTPVADLPLKLNFTRWLSNEGHVFGDLHVVLDELNRGANE